MKPEEWKRLASGVTDRMKEYTRPCVTAMRTSNQYGVHLLGTGSYVTAKGRRLLTTCEHVIRAKTAVEHQFWGADQIFQVPDPFVCDQLLDTAFAAIRETAWNAVEHAAWTIDLREFAPKHQPVDRELLFFRGFAGENARYGFGVHEANATGYCSQEPPGPPIAPELFEMRWVPKRIEFTEQTSDEMKAKMLHNDPRGFSGSLVWNTRFVELSSAGKAWRPEDAVITGLLCRYIEERETLAALRVEHLRGWLEGQV